MKNFQININPSKPLKARPSLRIMLSVLTACAMLISSSASNVLARGYTEKEKRELGIYFVGGDIGKCGSGDEDTDVDTTLEGKNNEEKAFKFFIKKGFSPKQSAGIIGNFIQESGVNPQRVEDGWGFPKTMKSVPPNKGPQGQPGFGIAQWTSPGRKENLKKYPDSENNKDAKGKPVSSLDLQLNFVIEEMKQYPGLSDNLKKVEGDDAIRQSAFLFHKVYEGSADSLAQIGERADSGREVFEKYGGATTAASQQDTPEKESCNESEGGDSSSGGKFNKINYESKDDLKSKILGNNNIKFGNFQDASVQKNDVRKCLTETTLVGFLSMAEQSGVKILVNALASDHGGCGNGSSHHNLGRAIDIGYYGNGQPNHNAEGDKLYKYLYDNANELKVDELIWTRPPSGYKCMDQGKKIDCSTLGGAIVAQHVHHIHVSFKK